MLVRLAVAGALACGVAAVPLPVEAQQPAASSGSLEIAHGTFGRDGRTVPATLKNLVDVLHERFPDANIILAGTSDIVVGNLSLRWGRSVSSGDLRGALTAFAVAGDRKFEVIPTAEWGFVLAPVPRAEIPDAGQRVEVIGLATYFAARDRARMELETLGPRLEMIKARVQAGIGQAEELQSVEHHVRVVQRELERFAKSPEELIKQIHEVSQLAIRQLHGDAAAAERSAPKLQFHPGAQLLIVTGAPETIAVVSQVVGALIDAR